MLYCKGNDGGMGFKEALEIIRANQIHSHREFAKLMWPDSDGWKHHHKTGRGSSCGTMMAMAAGGLLGKLRYRGLIRTPWHDDYGSYYSLTEKGRQYIQ